MCSTIIPLMYLLLIVYLHTSCECILAANCSSEQTLQCMFTGIPSGCKEGGGNELLLVATSAAKTGIRSQLCGVFTACA